MTTRVGSVFLIMLLAIGCSKDKGGAAGVPTGSAPSKELAITTLEAVNAALEAKDYTKAAGLFGTPPGATKEELAKQLERLIEIQEISAPGIKILAAKGTWGKLAEVFPDRAERFAGKFGVPVDQCYGLAFDQAEAGFHWTGTQLAVIRLDDIGKLAQ
jgi:hypothetical protein